MCDGKVCLKIEFCFVGLEVFVGDCLEKIGNGVFIEWNSGLWVFIGMCRFL